MNGAHASLRSGFGRHINVQNNNNNYSLSKSTLFIFFVFSTFFFCVCFVIPHKSTSCGCFGGCAESREENGRGEERGYSTSGFS